MGRFWISKKVKIRRVVEISTIKVNILAIGNNNSGKMETGLPVDGNHLNSA